MRLLLLSTGLGLLVAAVHITGLIVLGRLWGLRIARIGFLWGPTLVTFARGGITWSIGAIPFPSAYVGWRKGMDDDREDAEFDRLPRIRRALVVLVGPIFTFVLASALLGLARASTSLRNGFTQLIQMAASPLIEGQVLLNGMAQVAEVESLAVLLGVIAAKSTALNMLPIPVLNGGQAMISLLYKGPARPAWVGHAQVAGLVVLLVGLVGFLIATITFAIRT